jgi:hypothetical protein
VGGCSEVWKHLGEEGEKKRRNGNRLDREGRDEWLGGRGRNVSGLRRRRGI